MRKIGWRNGCQRRRVLTAIINRGNSQGLPPSQRWKGDVMNRRLLTALFITAFCLAMLACHSGPGSSVKAQSSPGVEQAVSDAVDVYVYGYPLVTMDMTRQQMTNVATPEGNHAPMGQILKARNYPPP